MTPSAPRSHVGANVSRGPYPAEHPPAPTRGQGRLLRHAPACVSLFLAAVALLPLLSGCANTGSLGDTTIPTAVLDVTLRLAGPVDENSYYFVAFNAGGDVNSFPVPVAAGPYWGNGWGTGAITHYVEYHLGQYNLFQTQLEAFLSAHTGGILSISGNVPGSEAGTYALTVTSVSADTPPVYEVTVVFTSSSTGQTTTTTGTLLANTGTPTATPPVPGLTITTGDLAVGDTATILVQFAPNGVLLSPKLFDYVPPGGGTELSFSFDLAALGASVSNLGFNFITTTQLIFDPTVTDPRQHTYDGLGPLGNDAIRRFDPRQFRTLTNADAFVREDAGDTTLQGPSTPAQWNAVDIVDWSVAVRRLR